jgi:hypothetical protein
MNQRQPAARPLTMRVFVFPGVRLLLAATPRLVSESRAARRGRPDIAGAALITLGLLLIVFGLLEKGNHPWLSFSVLGWVAIGIALLIGFTLVEARAAHPLVPLSFLRSRNRTIANTVRVCYYVGFATLFFSLSLYLRHGLNFSALETGFAFVPFGLTILVSATVLAPRLLRRFGLRTLNGGGLALSTVGYILLAGLTAHGTYLADVLPGLILVPLGGGLVLVGSTVAGVDGATGEDAGIATAHEQRVHADRQRHRPGRPRLARRQPRRGPPARGPRPDNGGRPRLRPELRHRGRGDRLRRAARLARDHPRDPRPARRTRGPDHPGAR